MRLHLIKLCVGCDSIEDLQDWVGIRLQEMRRAGEKPEHRHTTRMIPKRASELLDGGSLYWVIAGRDHILDMTERRDIASRSARAEPEVSRTSEIQAFVAEAGRIAPAAA